MKNARFHDEARLEFFDQITFYEEAQAGLGQRFRAEVEAAVALASSMPLAGSPYKFGTRRVFPKKFPFAVVYTVRQSEIVILAITHFKRRPGYWGGRKLTAN